MRASGPIRLVSPDPLRFQAWKECLLDFMAEEDAAAHMDGTGFVFREGELPDLTPDGFSAYLDERQRCGDLTVEQPEGRVHCTYLWIVDERWEESGPLLGFLSVRHALTQFLLDQAGHIGYSVRPVARRQGIATQAARAGIEQAQKLGAAAVLICCAEENAASRKVLEKNGGEYDGSRNGVRRYWFGEKPWPTAPTSP